ncbi:MAG TPA: dicarboxylate/amino acid:cation symporter, partial [Candidatus Polarisedimenticolia bacterium]|nr:dicarboxylate/amino acid:cation symporter [Candidatus Polarisedimenticolia bacterium]
MKPKRRPSTPLHSQILYGLVIGAVAGLVVNRIWGPTAAVQGFVDNVTVPAGKIFLRLIFMVVIPLIFSALVLGVAELGDLRRLGRVGLRTLVFTLVLSSISVLVGIAVVNIVQPGVGMAEQDKAQLIDLLGNSTAGMKRPEAKPFSQVILDLIPENPLKAMVEAFQGEMLAVMVFSLLIGVAMTLCERERIEPLLVLLRGVYDVVMELIRLAMKLAPIGVAALLFSLTARFGLDILKPLGWYMACVIGALAFHQFGVYALVLRWVVGYSPVKFFSRIREIQITAFSTSSSNATLPTTMRVAEENLGIPRRIGGFVLTVGSTANQNGTALYEGVTVLFLAQFYGVELNFIAQVSVVVMSILAGVGTAGVPGGSLPMVGALLMTIGVPWEGIGIILGVDRLLDMCRTVLNVTGDVVAAANV